MEKDKTHWLAWSHILNGRQLKKIFDYFENGQDAWNAPDSDFKRFDFQAETLKKIAEERPALDPFKIEKQLKESGIEAVMIGDPDYPSALAEIYDPPVLLFYLGRLPANEEVLLAIIGTRSASRYGQAAAITLTRELAAEGFSIVSGLARGIDALAHQTTLEVGGRTIGVLGTGLSNNDIYPAEHISLARKIIKSGGCLMSEYPPGTGPEKHHFPERNRIIAGLTQGTLIIEAPETSGALITARLALEYNREVMAVPGNIFEKNAAGVNQLIKLGAKVITCSADVIETLQLPSAPRENKERHLDISQEERLVLNALSQNPLHIDNVCQAIALDSAALGGTLTLLELKGLAKDVGGKYYIRLIEI